MALTDFNSKNLPPLFLAEKVIHYTDLITVCQEQLKTNSGPLLPAHNNRNNILTLTNKKGFG